ncbi:hypothetical protein [Dermacoccus nishinomiyaensis]|nr:hypothetical protein [Dermacoccus nishinomiyaensis]MCG7428616.1 hypothetical protein [Dermacoccus nishinomiyaensis]
MTHRPRASSIAVLDVGHVADTARSGPGGERDTWVPISPYPTAILGHIYP